jgi:hypothetical protein
MFLTGKWYPAAIIASPIAGFLAAISMVLGMLLLTFGRLDILVRLNVHVYSALESIFTFFATLPSSGWWGYLTLLSLVALPFVVLWIVHRCILKRCGNSAVGI